MITTLDQTRTTLRFIKWLLDIEMYHQRPLDRRARGSKGRISKLLFQVAIFLAAVVSLLPFTALYFHPIDFSMLKPIAHQLHSDFRRSNIVPCNFGACLKWNTTDLKPFPCAAIYPLRWFHEEWNDHAKALYERHKRTMHFEVINLIRTNSTPPSSCEDGYPPMITYFHIFKNGGTTVRNAFQREQTSLPYAAKILFTGIQQRIGTNRFHFRLNNTIMNLYEGQQQHRNSVYAFTFLRDPVARFLSGLGQVLNKYKTGKLSDSFELAPCFSLNASTTAMVDCSLEKLLPMMNDNQSHRDEFRFYDFHILPQSFLLRDFTGEQDVSMMLMDMKHISAVLETLLPSDSQQNQRRFWARQSRSADYTGGHNLRLSLLTLDQKRKICKLYHLDVELLAKTNVVPDNLCSNLS